MRILRDSKREANGVYIYASPLAPSSSKVALLSGEKEILRRVHLRAHDLRCVVYDEIGLNARVAQKRSLRGLETEVFEDRRVVHKSLAFPKRMAEGELRATEDAC